MSVLPLGKGDRDVLTSALAGLLGDNWALAVSRFLTDTVAPLAPGEIVEDYKAHRATMKQWISEKRLDVVKASLESLKRHLQPQRVYISVIGNPEQKGNVEAFFSDLPPDVRRQAAAWLKDRGFSKLAVRRGRGR